MSDGPNEGLKSALEELERLIATKAVAGERIEVGEYVMIPLCSVGFGMGAAEGSGRGARTQADGAGSGSGLGFGGGVRPVAVIVHGPNGVSVETIPADSGLDAAGIAKAFTSGETSGKA
jgi:uncharacterized spore protein YtfJ